MDEFQALASESPLRDAFISLVNFSSCVLELPDSFQSKSEETASLIQKRGNNNKARHFTVLVMGISGEGKATLRQSCLMIPYSKSPCCENIARRSSEGGIYKCEEGIGLRQHCNPVKGITKSEPWTLQVARTGQINNKSTFKRNL